MDLFLLSLYMIVWKFFLPDWGLEEMRWDFYCLCMCWALPTHDKELQKTKENRKQYMYFVNLHHVYERISFICGLIIASTSLTSVFVCQASWCQNDQDLLHWANSQTTCSVSVMVQVFIKINFLWKTFKYEGKMIAKIWVEIFRSC